MRCEWSKCGREGKERDIHGYIYYLCDMHYPLFLEKYGEELKLQRRLREELGEILRKIIEENRFTTEEVRKELEKRGWRLPKCAWKSLKRS